MIHEVRIPASTSNLGAGFDCVGMALDLWLTARLIPGSGPPRYSGTLTGLSADRDVVWTELCTQPAAAGHRLELHSDIPISRGLGSSAAATLALLVLRDALEGSERADDDLFREAATREGHPDNAAPCTFGGAQLVVQRAGSDRPLTIRLVTHEGLAVALAVPEQIVETRKARAVLPDRVPARDVVTQASRAAALVLGLERGDGDLLRIGMEDAFAVPRRAGLITGYEAAQEAAVAAGAFGMTISGSGSALVAIGERPRAAGVAAAMAHALTESGNPAAALTPAICQTGLTRLPPVSG